MYTNIITVNSNPMSMTFVLEKKNRYLIGAHCFRIITNFTI